MGTLHIHLFPCRRKGYTWEVFFRSPTFSILVITDVGLLHLGSTHTLYTLLGKVGLRCCIPLPGLQLTVECSGRDCQAGGKWRLLLALSHVIPTVMALTVAKVVLVEGQSGWLVQGTSPGLSDISPSWPAPLFGGTSFSGQFPHPTLPSYRHSLPDNRVHALPVQ